jgi:transcriptional regulator with GAF, ATPase, and Fis domain
MTKNRTKTTPKKSKERYTPEDVVAAITASNGLLAPAANKLGCDRRTMYNYAERYHI